MKYTFRPLICCCALLAAAHLVRTHHRQRAELRRLDETRAALVAEVEHYRNRLGEETAASRVLRLRCAEYEELRAADAERLRRLGIRLRRLEAASATTLATHLDLAAPLHPPGGPPPSAARDTSAAQHAPDSCTLQSAAHTFAWSDPWVRVEGCIAGERVHCRVEISDTLRQIVHRLPWRPFRRRRRQLRQEVSSSNPHTRIVATEYIRIER